MSSQRPPLRRIRHAAPCLLLLLAACKPATPNADSPATQPPASPPAAAPAAKTVTIRPVFPKPFFASGPFAANLPNLEAPGKAAPVLEFAVPAGTTLVSENLPVTASAKPLQGRLGMVTDGDLSSYPDALVALPGGGQWIQLDLGRPLAVQKIHLWHAHNRTDVYLDLVVQLSEDPEFKTGVITLHNADADNSLGLGAGADPAYLETNHGRVIDGRGAVARHVRVWGSGSYRDGQLRFAEVQVYASPPP